MCAEQTRIIYEKYAVCSEVKLSEIYADLDVHPIFPSDGYKDDIKRELKQCFNVTFKKGGKVIFPNKQGAVR